MSDDADLEDQLERIADALGRPLKEIRERYELLALDIKNIEEGPAPDFIGDWVPEPIAKGSTSSQKNTKKTSPNQSEKKVPWTTEEHLKLLEGIKKRGKGQWKQISSEFVKTKTPTQIASHAQKLYLHRNGTPKRRKRTSIYDLTIDDIDLVPQQNQVPQLNAPLQQNWAQLDAPMQQLSSQQNQVDALDFPLQQNGDPPLNFPHQVYPQHYCTTPWNVQQLSYQQNGHPPMNFPMQPSQEIQQSDLASQQYLVPPLDAPMQQLQETQHTLGDSALASEQHVVPTSEVMPMQQLQERPQEHQAIDSRHYAWKPVGNHGR
ncbi:transcription factor SRM1-like [Lotus japonicus]|uniref:transcription factor SRM1-like n=1 Tax=Lotus japonicus TaxID=34305 RepID=UPI00258F0E95|nr:transcription factor SRM1-like [Lotus japonicus]